MTIYMVISLPNVPYTHRIYMALANPSNKSFVGKSYIICYALLMQFAFLHSVDRAGQIASEFQTVCARCCCCDAWESEKKKVHDA